MFGITGCDYNVRRSCTKRERLRGEDYVNIETFGIARRTSLLLAFALSCAANRSASSESGR